MTSIVGGAVETPIAPSDLSASTQIVASAASSALLPLDAAGHIVALDPGAQAHALADPSIAGGGDATFSSKTMLGILGQLDPARVSGYVAAHEEAVSTLITAPPVATSVTAYWSGMNSDQQKALIDGAPRLIGNLDGVPFQARSRANRLQLTRAISDTRARLAGHAGKGVKLQLRHTLDTLLRVKEALKAPAGSPERSLVILDVGTNTRAAIAVGDVSTARYVSYLVPGMYFSVDQQLDDWVSTAENLYTEQRQWLRRSFGCRACAGTPGVAAVAWIGYQTPELLNVGGLALAQEGADYLEHGLEGLRALRAGDEPYVTVIAHSYGSTAALMALQRGSVSVDALALVGSPGSAAQSVHGLDVAGGNVYVGQAGFDPVVHTAFFGSDPGASAYGAIAFGVEGAKDPFGGAALAGSTGHNGYFTAGSESLRNLALIGIGQGGLVTPATGSATQLAAGR
ncbi:alpha/beta hydrolase [Microbacterium sp. STN6]|uniref:alpha/beta hydrolase n=1 Tax=Microbacterium sp. STN6 TaxID=2995588 RepID=UPI0022609465|nr:alpha/beta hydrolase [Microbacterium sp. STN6]MCX7522155.1 alpha/beta hydrolase [Microbacterium sp. STN6]